MEQLDLVYSAFSNLEKNYHKSTKTRTEYIADKFGGDIDVGSFVILHRLGNAQLSDPEDFRKLSEIRKIFSAIVDHKDVLDAIPSFDALTMDECIDLGSALSIAEEEGTGISYIPQETLYKKKGKPLHYLVDNKSIKVAPFNICKYVNLFSNAMATNLRSSCTDRVSMGDILERAPGTGVYTRATKVTFK